MRVIPLIDKYGRWAVVTGASSGIGKAFAIRLAQDGFNLVLVARRQSELDEVSSELKIHFHVETVVLALDLSHKNSNEELFVACRELDVGILVASAGFGSSGLFTELDRHEELNMIDVNCRAVAEQVHYFADLFSARNRGGIIMLSSIVAFQGVPLSSTYAATKAFVQTLAEGLYFELRPFNVDVLAVAPGPVQSGFSSRARLSPGKMEDADIVAGQSIAALGKMATLRPGFLAKLLAVLLTVPRAARIRIMSLVMAGMTQHQKKDIVR
jgi:short-subunit dehydrogenase